MSLLKGPNQEMVLRRLEKSAPPQHTQTFSNILRLWQQGTLTVDGSRRIDSATLVSEISECLNDLMVVRERETNIFVHDALHFGRKLLRLLRFVLNHPSRSSGTTAFRFPKSERRLTLLIAAEHFFDGSESDDERARLKHAFGKPDKGIAAVSKNYAVFAFQSPAAFHLLTPYETQVISKEHTTKAEIKKLVNDNA